MIDDFIAYRDHQGDVYPRQNLVHRCCAIYGEHRAAHEDRMHYRPCLRG